MARGLVMDEKAKQQRSKTTPTSSPDPFVSSSKASSKASTGVVATSSNVATTVAIVIASVRQRLAKHQAAHQPSGSSDRRSSSSSHASLSPPTIATVVVRRRMVSIHWHRCRNLLLRQTITLPTPLCVRSGSSKAHSKPRGRESQAASRATRVPSTLVDSGKVRSPRGCSSWRSGSRRPRPGKRSSWGSSMDVAGSFGPANCRRTDPGRLETRASSLRRQRIAGSSRRRLQSCAWLRNLRGESMTSRPRCSES